MAVSDVFGVVRRDPVVNSEHDVVGLQKVRTQQRSDFQRQSAKNDPRFLHMAISKVFFFRTHFDELAIKKRIVDGCQFVEVRTKKK